MVSEQKFEADARGPSALAVARIPRHRGATRVPFGGRAPQVPGQGEIVLLLQVKNPLMSMLQPRLGQVFQHDQLV